MRVRASRLLAAAALLAASLVPANAQTAVNSYVNFNWLNITQAACIERGTQAINEALLAFPLPGATTRVEEWNVLARNDEVNFWVYCIADNDTLLDPAAGRVLTIVSVNSGREDFGEALRDFLADCMAEAVCPAAATAGPIAIAWDDIATLYRSRTGQFIDFVCPARGGSPCSRSGAQTSIQTIQRSASRRCMPA